MASKQQRKVFDVRRVSPGIRGRVDHEVVALDIDRIGGYKWCAVVARFCGSGAKRAAADLKQILNSTLSDTHRVVRNGDFGNVEMKS